MSRMERGRPGYCQRGIGYGGKEHNGNPELSPHMRDPSTCPVGVL